MTEKEAQSFLDKGSFRGCKILYAFYLAYKKEIAVDIVKFLEHIGEDKNGYSYGYLVCAHASNVITFKIHKEIVTVTKYDDGLRLVINNHVKKQIETHDSVLSKEHQDRWASEIKVIEEYFII